MTNIEYIKNLTTAEMSAMINQVNNTPLGNIPCNFCNFKIGKDCIEGYNPLKCSEGIRKWLESERKEND